MKNYLEIPSNFINKLIIHLMHREIKYLCFEFKESSSITMQSNKRYDSYRRRSHFFAINKIRIEEFIKFWIPLISSKKSTINLNRAFKIKKTLTIQLFFLPPFRL